MGSTLSVALLGNGTRMSVEVTAGPALTLTTAKGQTAKVGAGQGWDGPPQRVTVSRSATASLTASLKNDDHGANTTKRQLRWYLEDPRKVEDFLLGNNSRHHLYTFSRPLGDITTGIYQCCTLFQVKPNGSLITPHAVNQTIFSSAWAAPLVRRRTHGLMSASERDSIRFFGLSWSAGGSASPFGYAPPLGVGTS